MLTRREWLASGSAGALLAQERSPNIVLLMTDQQTISALSAAATHMSGHHTSTGWHAVRELVVLFAGLFSGTVESNDGLLPYDFGCRVQRQPFKPDVPTAGEPDA